MLQVAKKLLSQHLGRLGIFILCVLVLEFTVIFQATAFIGHRSTKPTRATATKSSVKRVVSTPKVAHLTSSPKSIPTHTTTPSTSPVVAPPKTTTTTTTTRTSAKPTQAVVPSPSSNVSSLTPTTPTAPSNPSPSSPATYTSTNWAGYMATTGNYTAISASWVAPSVSGNGVSTSADATWIGIGGVTTADLIQVGTQNVVTASGQVSTGAFYEMLPDVSQNVPSLTISPGDSITASLVETSAGQWTISLTDETSGQSFTDNVAYTSSNSSAEWIEEDPSFSDGQLVPLDNFGTTTFSDGSTTSNNSALNLSSSNASQITLVDKSGQDEATTSAITGGGEGFSVTWQAP